MSRFRQPNGHDYVEAAKRNYADADTLFRSRRFDGCYYLSGYVIECVLKTLIQYERGNINRVKEHSFSDLSREIALLASVSGGKSSRYLRKPVAQLYGFNKGKWNEQTRYFGYGKFDLTDARLMLNEAGYYRNSVIDQMGMDGEL